MKKILITILAIIAITNVNAQMRHGVRAGYAMSDVKAEFDGTKMDNDIRSTFYLGYFTEFKLSDKVAIQPELMFSPLGSKLTVEVLEKKIESVTNFGTLSLPLSVKYFVTEGFALSGGLNFGFNLIRRGKSDGGDWEDFSDKIKIFNFGPFVSLEYNLKNGLFIDARYTLGLNEISKVDKVTSKNNFILVGLGYKF